MLLVNQRPYVFYKTSLTTSGIPGGYRLVSTYDLPGCKILKFEIWSFSRGGGGYSETLRFGLSDNFHLGGILKLSDLDTMTIFIWGGYSETLGFGLYDNFHWEGGILKLSDLDCLTIFIGGGVETLRFGLYNNFHFGGGILKLSDLDSLTIFIGGRYPELQNRGILSEFGPKFQPLQQAHASQIVSHILHMWRLINKNAFQ